MMKNKPFDVKLVDNKILRFELSDGDILYHPSGEGSFEEFFTIYYSNIIADQYRTYRISEGDVVIDCGAHIGCFSLAAQKSGAFVYAVEPLKINLMCLELLSRYIHNVSLVPAVVSDVNGLVKFDAGTKGSSGGHIQETGEHNVCSITIDNLVSRFKLSTVDFIKMDIEGAEIEALKGAETTIKRFKPKLSISAYHWLEAPRDIKELLLSYREDYKIETMLSNPFCELVLHAD